MGAQISAQVTPCLVVRKSDRELLPFWAKPSRDGLGNNDFYYSYEVPPTEEEVQVLKQDEAAGDGSTILPRRNFVCEGKLSFHEYVSLVRALHNGSLLQKGMFERFCLESWAGYDPYSGCQSPAPRLEERERGVNYPEREAEGSRNR